MTLVKKAGKLWWKEIDTTNGRKDLGSNNKLVEESYGDTTQYRGYQELIYGIAKYLK